MKDICYRESTKEFYTIDRKWRNILPIEYNKLDGIIVTEEWFRDAKLVYVVHLI